MAATKDLPIQISEEEFRKTVACINKKISEGEKAIPGEWKLHENYMCKIEKRVFQECCYRLEFHIVYSEAYSVPVLYFNAYNETGTPVTRDILKRMVIRDANAEFTQQMHPFFNLPFWMLNPCRTTETMEVLSASFERTDDCEIARGRSWLQSYVTIWLSVCSQLVHMDVDPWLL